MRKIMNKIFKVIYSKTRHCYVVVSELAKSHCKTTQSHTVRSKTALTAAVLLALGAFSFVGMPVVQAADGTESLRNNDFVGANDYYWYYDEKEKDKDKKWKTYQYKATDIFNNRSRHDLPNYQGGGAKLPGAITAGLYAQAGQQTVTIGDRNAGQSKGSVFIGEHSGYNNGDNAPAGMKNNYVTSVGFQSDATGWGSIAIGSNATAENSKMESQVVEEVGDAHTSGTVRDDTYGIKENPKIQGASVALGYNAHSNDGNIAIGSYSDATSTDKNDSYVSVGNANLKRRITNVADGASASDVATVGQLQALSDKVGVYDAGFGIKIASDKDNKTNTISLNRNLGTNYTDKAHHGDEKVTVAVDDTGLVLGGYAEDEKGNKKNPAVTYGATGDDSVTVGGMNSLASGRGSVVTGGVENIASGATAVAIGGNNNDAIGTRSAVLGGLDNTAFGNNSMVSGGSYNVAGGIQSAVLGGFSNYALGTGTTSIGGYGKDYGTGYDSSVNGDYSVGVAGGSTGKDAKHALAAGNQAVVTTENGTAIGYQATTDEANTIAFGHDADDVSGYTIEWNKLPEGQVNADGTTNDYTKAPKSVTPTTYKDAYYNRLVKVADGQDDHDVVVMEQLKQYAKKDASNIGNNLTVTPVYQTDDQGNIKLGSDNKPLIDKEKTEQKRKDDQTTNKNDWGQALGADPFTAGTATTATDASTSDQLVTGKTLYNYDAPVAASDKKLNYVSANNTTGQNLSALDAQVKANADELNKPNRNIKYYSVKDSSLTVDGYTNENNDGAKGRGSLAAGFVTHADGIASTVVGSYSGVMNTGTALGPLGRDYRGATAVSLGTVNVNNNTDTSKPYSGVANSIVGQANMTTNSNAAIIYGAGNTVTDSYRPIDSTKAWAILGSVSDPKELSKAMQAAVKDSGGQVMVMGGGNTVDKAYMTQVTGVGNTVTGTDSTYAEGTSTQYNFVDGFQNELTNGKHDYIIGSNNKVSGESIDKNQSNIVFGDNHKLTNQKNNVIIGSSDTADDETTASDVVAIGHNAKVTKEGGVAIGSGSEATTAAGVAGYDPTGATADTTAAWTSKKAAVSVGTADETRQITGVAAGKEETDAVNVAQLKKLNGMKANVNADNIGKNLKGSDGITPATEEEQKANLNQWGEAIGTG
ncbi:ESPR-type extended signal peptide-containing protein, partial [Megasphaera elsdenii]|uniref:ESPR-type extended signal peptide-containing protein n=2 Tax=Megasphaera elsdenii TaxID=907 RepID=UPI003119C597